MNWDELKKIWKEQPLAACNERALQAADQEFSDKRRKLARQLFWRDVTEAAAGILVAAVFAWVGWKMGRAGWPIAAAVVLMAGLSGFFVQERIRVRRGQPGADAPILVRLDAEILEQQRQQHLLRNVGSWYLGPCMLAGGIFCATVLANAPVPKAAMLLAAGLMMVVFGACSWAVIALNRRAVRLIIEPRLKELVELKKSLVNAE